MGQKRSRPGKKAELAKIVVVAADIVGKRIHFAIQRTGLLPKADVMAWVAEKRARAVMKDCTWTPWKSACVSAEGSFGL